MNKNIFLLFLVVIISITSCRKKQVYKKKKIKTISKEMKEAIKKNETAKILWKNRTDIYTLEKTISLWEEVLPYIDTIDVNLYLAEAYYLHSLFPIKDQIKIVNYKKAIFYSYKILLEVSKEYKSKKEENIQDYKIINLIPENRAFILYLYTINNLLLRIKENTLLLYRDDIFASIEHLEKISPIGALSDIYNYKAYYYYYLPQIGGGDKKVSKDILNNLEKKDFFSKYLKIIFFSNNKTEDFKTLVSKKEKLNSRDKILYKEIYKKVKTEN